MHHLSKLTNNLDEKIIIICRIFINNFPRCLLPTLTDPPPQVKDYFEALYYGVCTLTTVGGITPETAEGRIVVIVSILAGIAIIPLQLSELGEAYFQREQELLPGECILPDGADGVEGVEGVEGGWEAVGGGGDEVGGLERRVFQGGQRWQQTEGPGASASLPFGSASGALGSVAQVSELTGAACGACGAVGHRRDAIFCYRCSSRIGPLQSGGAGVADGD